MTSSLKISPKQELEVIGREKIQTLNIEEVSSRCLMINVQVANAKIDECRNNLRWNRIITRRYS